MCFRRWRPFNAETDFLAISRSDIEGDFTIFAFRIRRIRRLGDPSKIFTIGAKDTVSFFTATTFIFVVIVDVIVFVIVDVIADVIVEPIQSPAFVVGTPDSIVFTIRVFLAA